MREEWASLYKVLKNLVVALHCSSWRNKCWGMPSGSTQEALTIVTAVGAGQSQDAEERIYLMDLPLLPS